METQTVIEGNKLIAEFMGADTYTETIEITTWDYNMVHNLRELHYHESWDWLMPVVRKIVELCCDPDNDELFESDHYTSILETIPLAIMEDAYKVTVEFIKWYNEERR